MTRKIIGVITTLKGDRVIVGESELRHAQEHFLLPDDIFLELLERVLKDPSEIFADDIKHPTQYLMFYRLENKRFIVAVVKVTSTGHYFTSMYPTGSTIRNTRRKLRRLTR